MFRWGILSTAKIARDQVLPAIADAHNCVISGIASRDGGRARALADRFGAEHAFDSYEALLNSESIDGVYIPLPTSQHVEWSLKAAAAGKHVLCEKPIAMHASEIEQLIAAREKYGVLISEAFMVCYHPQWHKVRALIQDGAIGQLRQVHGAFTFYNVDADNMRNQPSLGGGALRDIGVYPFVTTRFVTGIEPQRIQSRIQISPEFGTDIYASVISDFGDFELSFYCSTQMALRQNMVFHGENGWIEVHAPFNTGDYGFGKITLNSVDHDTQQIFRFSGERQYRSQVEAFVEATKGGDAAIFTLENSQGNQRAIDAVFAAGKHGDWQPVSGDK